MFVPDKVLIHHSATKDAGTVDWQQIRKYHTTPESEGGPKGGPWRDIGYHGGVELVKTGTLEHYEILYGRMWNQAGAHCPGQNETALGICFIGNFSLAPCSEEQLMEGAKLVAMWTKLFHIPPGEIYPHKEFKDTECPGTLFDLSELKHLVTYWLAFK
jgi:hypothetical protein